MNFFMPEVPNYAKKEIEKLNEIIAPFMKKVSKYSFWSFPLIFISIINIIMLLMLRPNSQHMIVTLFVYAGMGAFGMALSKEAKHQSKEIQKLSVDYMVKRIHQSVVAPPHVKKKYSELINEHPLKAMQYFIQFLQEEEKVDHDVEEFQ